MFQACLRKRFEPFRFLVVWQSNTSTGVQNSQFEPIASEQTNVRKGALMQIKMLQNSHLELAGGVAAGFY